MEALINSFLIVFVGEMGDKTQLLALILVTRYRRPGIILIGIFCATILNHALAAFAGAWVSQLFSPTTLLWILALSFFVFGLWVLIPDKEGDIKQMQGFGVFATTVISFFIAEMGDKTQLATVALGARYAQTYYVTLGTTLGMMASNALAVFFGEKFLKRIPMKWVRGFACGLFMLFGLMIVFKIVTTGAKPF